MKDYVHFYGVDVSKKTVDIVYTDKQVTIHQKFNNDVSGMDQLLQWLTENNASASNTLFCMEATGLYCLTLTNFLYSKSIDVWIEHASTIKRATALARGKPGGYDEAINSAHPGVRGTR
jgi:transposase